MANQNGRSGNKKRKNITVRAVRKDSAADINTSQPFDFESADSDVAEESGENNDFWSSSTFATNNDFDFGTSEPMAFASNFEDLDNDLSEDDGFDSAGGFAGLDDDDDVPEQKSNASDDKFESEFYGGIDDMSNKKKSPTGKKTTSGKNAPSKKTNTSSKAAAAAKRKAEAERRRKIAKRNKILKNIGVTAAALMILCAVGGILYMTMLRTKAPYMIESGLAETNATNIDALLDKCLSENLAEKTLTIEVEGKTYAMKLSNYGFGYEHDGIADQDYIDTELADGSYRVDKITTVGKISFNETAIREFINSVAAEHGTPMVMPSYTIDGATLKVVTGKDGMSVDFDELTKQIINKACTGDTSAISLGISVLPAPAVDIQQIYREVKCDPVDASVTVGEDGVAVYVDEIMGKDFDVTDAEQKIAAGGTSWDIPLTLTAPAVTVQKLKAPTCPDTLSENSTKYSESNENRSNNVKLAGKYINGLVLQPGEVFSFNTTVGKRTKERGFKSATVYSGEGLDEDYGGGICQTSSTVYYAAIKANLEIVQRVNHYFTVGYWNLPGADATVSWGGPDLKIKNNKEYPIKFVIESGNGRITCKIMGTNIDNTEAYFEYEITKTIKYETVMKLPVKGKKNKNTSGSNGMVVKTYRVVKRDGKQVSKKLEATSTYRPLNAVIYDSSAVEDKTTATTKKEQATTTITTPAPTAAATEEE